MVVSSLWWVFLVVIMLFCRNMMCLVWLSSRGLVVIIMVV